MTLPLQNFVANQTIVTAAWLNEVDLLRFSMQTGNFVATCVGLGSGTTSGTAIWRTVNGICTLALPTFNGVSNSNQFTVSGLPAFIRPATRPAQEFTCPAADNGIEVGDATIQVIAGSGTLIALLHGSTTGWTATGNKSLGGIFTYILD